MRPLYTHRMISATLALLMSQQELKLPPMETNTLLIFKSGTRPEGITQEAIQEMQKGHMANIVRLWNDKKTPLAGPFENGGDFRGIIILTIPKEKVAAELEQDPFVKNGLLKYELYSWMMPKGIFSWTDTGEMQKVTFGWVKKGPNYKEHNSAANQKATVEHVNLNLDLMRNGSAGVIGPLTEENAWALGVYIFLTDSPEKVKEMTKNDPHLKSGRFVLETKSLWIGKGLFKKLEK